MALQLTELEQIEKELSRIASELIEITIELGPRGLDALRAVNKLRDEIRVQIRETTQIVTKNRKEHLPDWI